MALARNIHKGLPLPAGVRQSDVFFVKGDYEYFHYGCDGQDDRGWGCGYRTLQSICSWLCMHCNKGTGDVKQVPTLQGIQETLVSIGDKPKSFLHSKDWIGSVEVGLVIDVHYNVPCKILHIPNGSEIKEYWEELKEHFRKKSSPIMMGGDSDASSKGIFGVCHSQDNKFFLIVDPHYYGPRPTRETLQESNMLVWKSIDSFMEHSFYNLCLPQFVPGELTVT